MTEQQGMFITFEGLDGCGKSTQAEKLARALRSSGHTVISTREPGGTEMGERIRALLLDSRTLGLAAETELALMFAARAQHVQETILPALQAGKIVLCDRFSDSSEAYQGGGRGLGSEPVLALHRALCGDLQPQLTILMEYDVTASVARARRRNHAHGRKRGRSADEGRFEHENQRFFERVHEAYEAIARREPQRVVRVDARRPIEVVHRDILEKVRQRLRLQARNLGRR